MENSVIMLVLKFKKEMNAEQIKQQIQELQKLANEMLDANNLNSEIFEQISQQIEKYQSQQKKLAKLADEAKYLHEGDIMALYRKKSAELGKTEEMECADGILVNKAKEFDDSLETKFNNFITDDTLTSQVVFICENNHWMTVRLEKTPEDGMTYQVADSIPENPTNNKFNREERIDALLGGICTKIPFKSEKQQNGYDCGIYCALNAVDMGGGDIKYGLTSVKATYSKYDVDTIRKNFENQPKPKDVVKQPMPQQPPKESAKEDELINALKTNVSEGKITTEKAIKSIEFIKDRVENTLRNAFKQENKSTFQQKSIERLLERIDALTDFEKELNQTKQQQQSSRLSSASTASSFSNSPKQLNKNSQLQRPRSASSTRSNISMTEPPLKTRQVSATPQKKINNALQDFVYGRR